MPEKLCTGCGVFKPLDDAHFPKRKTKTVQGWRWDSWCRECYRNNTKRNNLKDPERKRQADRDYHERTKDLRREYNRRRAAEYNRLEATKQSRRKHHQSLKRRAMEGYGGAFCKCCGEHMLEFLTLDHINSDGKAHRRQLGGGRGNGARFYKLLADQGFPPGLQVLCMNCNWARHWAPDHICPHELARQELTHIREVPSAHQAP